MVIFVATGAVILHLIPRTTYVRLELHAQRLDFVLSGAENEKAVIEGLPLTSLRLLHIVEPLTMTVKALREHGHPLDVTPGSRVRLQPLEGREATLTIEAQRLRLTRLLLATGARVTLDTHPPNEVLVRVKNVHMSHLDVAVFERFTLTVQHMDLVYLDAQEQVISTRPVQQLEVIPQQDVLQFIQPASHTFGMTMAVVPQETSASTWPIVLPLGARLPVTQVNFVDEENRTTVQKFHLDPVMAPGTFEQDVFVALPATETFTLEEVRFEQSGLLLCTFTGRTAQVMVGQGTPHTNRVPSWFTWLLEHVIVKTLLRIFGK